MQFREINNKYSIEKIRTGYPTTEVLGDELDSASVFLTDINEIDIEPYDVVELTDLNDEISYCLIANYVKEYATFQEPYKYNYQVNLMSLTKKLETIVLPNLSISNIGQNRAVSYYIRTYAQHFFKEDFEVEIPEKLQNMTCPELTFNTPTLRELLDTLYSLNGCLVKLKYNGVKYIITYQDLNERKSEMPREYIATMTSSATADNYVSSLESDIDEFISKDILTEVQMLKSEEYAFDSNNAKLLLTHDIYDLVAVEVKNVEVDFNVKITGYKDGYGKGSIIATYEGTLKEYLGRYVKLNTFDISGNIVNERIFESLPILKSGAYNPTTMKNELYKNNTLYFKRGSNSIDNFNFYQTGNLDWILGQDDTAFNQLVRIHANSYINNYLDNLKFYGFLEIGSYQAYWVFEPLNTAVDNVNKVVDSWKNAVLEIDYIPYTSSRFGIEKNKYSHSVEMFNNQTESMVDIESFSRQSLEKVRQLGNDALEFSARNQGTEIMYELGMTFNDYILAKLETIHYLDQTYYKGILYKNFSNRNIQTILNRQKRYTALQDASESIVRHEVIKKEFNVAFSNSVYQTTPYLRDIAKYVKFTTITNTIPNEQVVGYILPTYVMAGNAFIYTIEFADTASYGINRNGVIVGTEYETLQYLKYVNDYGEIYGITLDFYKDYNHTEDFARYFPEENTATQGKELLFSSGLYDILKDNREHLKISYELLFKSDRFVVGNAFSSIIGNNEVKVKAVDFTINELTDTSSYGNYDYDFTYILNGEYRFNGEIGNNYILYNENGLVLGINNFNEKNNYIVLIEK